MPYKVFMGMTYYPMGGYRDFQDSFATREDAIGFIKAHAADNDWFQIVLNDEVIDCGSPRCFC